MSNEKPEHEYSKWTEQQSRPVSGSVASRNDVLISLSCFPKQRFRPILIRFNATINKVVQNKKKNKKKTNGIKTIDQEILFDFLRSYPLADKSGDCT